MHVCLEKELSTVLCSVCALYMFIRENFQLYPAVFVISETMHNDFHIRMA